MSDRPPPDLGYEPSPPGGGLTRRQGRWIILLLFLNTCFLGVYVLAPQLVQGVRQSWNDWQARRAAAKAAQAQAVVRAQQVQQSLALEQQWRSYEFPAGTVVYEEDPKLAAEYMISGKGYRAIPTSNIAPFVDAWQTPVIAPSPPPLTGMSGSGYGGSEGLLLVHERQTPAGRPKLVFVSILGDEAGYQIGTSSDKRVNEVVTLFANAFEPIDPSSPSLKTTGVGRQWKSQSLKLHRPPQTNSIVHMNTHPTKVDPGAYLRIMTGSADIKDPTHFTIPYRFGDSEGVVDGWLREDAIELRPRDGQIQPQSSWMLPAPIKR